MNRHVKYGLLSFLLIIFQTQVMGFLSLEGVTPDLLAIWVVYLALREGQLAGTAWGFGIGLAADLITGNFLGLSAMSKTVCGFLGGYFYNETKTHLVLGNYRFIIIVLISSLVQDLIYFLIFTQGTDIGPLRALLQFGVTTSLYTTAMAVLPILLFSRQQAA